MGRRVREPPAPEKPEDKGQARRPGLPSFDCPPRANAGEVRYGVKTFMPAPSLTMTA